MTVGSEAPLASGSLADTPFVHLILYLYRQSGAGTLHVRTASGAMARVRVRHGRPVAARSTEGGRDLRSALLPLCGWQEGDFLFYGSDNIDENAPDDALALVRTLTGSLDPYALLYASLDDHARDDMVDAVLARYPFARLMIPADRDVGRLGLDDVDRAIVASLRQTPAAIATVIAQQAALPAQRVRRLLYALLVTHMLAPEDDRLSELYQSQVGDEQAPSVPPTEKPARTSASPTSTSSSTSSSTSGMREPPARAAPPRTSTPAARSPEPKPVTGTVNEVASAAMPAWQLLMSMRESTTGESPRPKGAGPPAAAPTGTPTSASTPGIPSMRAPGPLRVSMSNANDPAVRRKRAEQFVTANRFAEALALLEELVTAEPKDAKLQGLRARALFEVHRADVEGLPRTVIEAVKRTHELDPDESQAYYVKGLVFKQGGELAKAMACWKRAVTSDPKNLDAERELRLARLRNT